MNHEQIGHLFYSHRISRYVVKGTDIIAQKFEEMLSTLLFAKTSVTQKILFTELKKKPNITEKIVFSCYGIISIMFVL
jgi:hypothetical protein